MDFKVCEGDECREQCRALAAPFGEEGKQAERHQAQREGRRQARGIFRHRARQRGGCGDAPVQQGRLEGDFRAVVYGQDPVAIVEHRNRHNRLARFAARVEERTAEKEEKGRDAEKRQHPQRFSRVAIMIFRYIH